MASRILLFLGLVTMLNVGSLSAQKAVKSPSIDLKATYPIVLLENICSEAAESLPAFSSTGDTLFFVSRRGPEKYDRLWFSTCRNAIFSEPALVSTTLDGTTSGGITSDKKGSYYLVRATGSGGADLDLFSIESFDPLELKPVLALNTAAWDAHPSLSPNGKQMYFVSNRKSLVDKSQLRNTDIYVTHKNAEDEWSDAARLPNHVNSGLSEGYPTIDRDGKTLYFARFVVDRNIEILMTKIDTNGEWSNPVALPAPFNSDREDASIAIHPSGDYAVIASNRSGGLGELDLYLVTLKKDEEQKK